MHDVETSFEKLLGRQPSEKEIQDLYRVKNALNIRDNDALWVILMAFQSYDSLYRKYPAMISDQVEKTLESQRTTMAALAETETKRAVGALADAVSKTSEQVAGRIAESIRWQSWGWTWFAFVSFSSLCVFVGFVLGSGRIPYWSGSPDHGLFVLILGSVAKTPAGWIAACGAALGATGSLWRARQDLMAGRRLGLLLGSAALLTLALVLLLPFII